MVHVSVSGDTRVCVFACVLRRPHRSLPARLYLCVCFKFILLLIGALVIAIPKAASNPRTTPSFLHCATGQHPSKKANFCGGGNGGGQHYTLPLSKYMILIWQFGVIYTGSVHILQVSAAPNSTKNSTPLRPNYVELRERRWRLHRTARWFVPERM